MRARLILPGLLAATALTLTGCGTQDNASSSSAAEPASPTASGTSAPDQSGSGTESVPLALDVYGPARCALRQVKRRLVG